MPGLPKIRAGGAALGGAPIDVVLRAWRGQEGVLGPREGTTAPQYNFDNSRYANYRRGGLDNGLASAFSGLEFQMENFEALRRMDAKSTRQRLEVIRDDIETVRDDIAGLPGSENFTEDFLSHVPVGQENDVEWHLTRAGMFAAFMLNFAAVRPWSASHFMVTPGFTKIDGGAFGMTLGGVNPADKEEGESDLAFLERVAPGINWQADAFGSGRVGAFNNEGSQAVLIFYVPLPVGAGEEDHSWFFTPSSGPPERDGKKAIQALLATAPIVYENSVGG